MPEGTVGSGTPTTLYSGQITLTAVAAQISVTSVPIKSITIENVNTNNVAYYGPAGITAATGYAIRPGATISIDINNLNKLYVLGTAGNVITYIAVN